MAEGPMKKYMYHKPGESVADALASVRTLFATADRDLRELIPNGGRELAVAMTHLETAAMWAVKALVVNAPDSVADESSVHAES